MSEIDKLKKDLELIITKANEYDKLDHKFKLTCGKGAQEVLQHITKFGLVGGKYEPVEVPKCMGDFLDNTFGLEETSLMCTMQNFTESDYFIEYCEIPLEKYPQGWDRLLVSAIENGYTVAKEPLYIMPVPYTHNGTLHYCLKDDGEISFRQGNAYKFTKDQIEEYFPEIKDLAVPVEEEAE